MPNLRIGQCRLTHIPALTHAVGKNWGLRPPILEITLSTCLRFRAYPGRSAGIECLPVLCMSR